MKFLVILVSCVVLLSGCNTSDLNSSSVQNHKETLETYKIDFPAGWKVEKVESPLFPGVIAEQASNEDGAVLMVGSSNQIYDYTKHYQYINNDLAMLVADNLYGPLMQSICPNAGLGGRPSTTPLNGGRSIQALYVCNDEVVWITTVFGRRKAYMIIASGDKHDKKLANAAMKSRNTFQLIEEKL